MKNILSNQRGALFGIDARIMLAIFSGLAVVTGVSMGGILTGSKATGVIKDAETIQNAVAAIQQDFGAPIHNLSGVNSTKDLISLFKMDATYLDTERQKNWLGPYIDAMPIDSNFVQNRFFGPMALEVKKRDRGTCSTANSSPCYYWLRIGKVPLEIAGKVDEQIDGSKNAATGKVQVQTIGSASPIYNNWGPNALFIRLGAAIKR